MDSRKLGQNLSVSTIGYGAMGLSEFYGETNDTESLNVLRTVVETGVNLIDTADVYGRGHNESLIGDFVNSLAKNQQQQIRIATKCGIHRPADAQYARSINNDPDYIRRSCDSSLKRLGVEQIDLYYLHRINPQASIEESMSCLSDLVKAGKIAHVGLCEVSAATLEKAHSVHPVTALQTEYSLWTRDIEQEILPTAIKLGVGIVPYSPLGRGFLTGKYRNNNAFSDTDFRKNNPRFSDTNLSHNAKILAALTPLAEKYHCTLGQISLAWLLAQHESIVPIPGTKNSLYVKENAAAVDIQLSTEDIAYISNLKNTIAIKGERYTLEGMKGVNA